MKQRKIFLILFIILFIIAILPRSIELLNGNYIFGYDQGIQWLSAKKIVVDHKFPLIGSEVGGIGGFFQGPGWFYLLAVFFYLFRGDPYGGIVLVFLSSVATVVLGYLLFRKSVGQVTALTVALMLAMSPSLISHARLMWPPFMIPPLTVLVLFCFLKGFHKQVQWFMFGFFMIGMMAHFEIATSVTFAIASGVYLIALAIRRTVPFRILFLSFFAYIVPLAPLFLFDIRHNFLNFHGVINLITQSKGTIQTFGQYMPILENHWVIFSHDFGRTFQVQFFHPSVVATIIILGFILFLRDKKMDTASKRFVSFLFVLPLVLFIEFLFLKHDMWPWWITELLVTNSILFGIFIAYFFGKKGIFRVGAIIVIFLMMLSYSKMTYSFFTKEYGDFGGVHKIKGKEEVLDLIYTDAGDEKFGLLIFAPPVYIDNYDYLLTWYGKKKYGYIPPYEKKHIFYVLIEPDWEHMWRHKGWLETVVVDGTVTRTWNLASGFIIEKRVTQ